MLFGLGVCVCVRAGLCDGMLVVGEGASERAESTVRKVNVCEVDAELELYCCCWLGLQLVCRRGKKEGTLGTVLEDVF